MFVLLVASNVDHLACQCKNRSVVCAIAGFSWQIHAAALKTTQAFVAKLQEAEPASVPQEQAALFMDLIPGSLAHSSYALDSKQCWLHDTSGWFCPMHMHISGPIEC